jgi:hypothetical protein
LNARGVNLPLVAAALLVFAQLASGPRVSVAIAETPSASTCTLDRAASTTIDADPVVSDGYGAVYDAATGRIAFTQPDLGGFYRVMTMRADGSDVRALDADRPAIPRKHQGSPSWYRSGRLLLFTAQKPSWNGRTLFGIPDYEALPGYGRHDDLWIASPDGSDARQLTDDPDTKDEGVLIPVFSRDGKRIAWSQRLPGGTYELRVADFAPLPVPHLENVRTYRPGGAAYYETGAFSSDDGSLTYTSDQDTHSFWHSQIYLLDLASGRGTRLTDHRAYDEHPVVIATPTGDWIVYMSSADVERRPGHLLLGTDWWAMRLDGSGTKRLTRMNAPNDPENTGAMQVAGRVSPGPTPDVLFGDVQDSLVKQTGFTKRIHLVCP